LPEIGCRAGHAGQRQKPHDSSRREPDLSPE
jgi:hypothetical protein